MGETKIESAEVAPSAMGQKYLASGKTISMRLWANEQPGVDKKPVARDYETVGYVISGRAELHIGEEITALGPGDSWVVAKGVTHTYKILEPFTAIEATHPPAQDHNRDAPSH